MNFITLKMKNCFIEPESFYQALFKLIFFLYISKYGTQAQYIKKEHKNDHGKEKKDFMMEKEVEVFLYVSGSNENLSFNANKILFFNFTKDNLQPMFMQFNSNLSILLHNNILLTV